MESSFMTKLHIHRIGAQAFLAIALTILPMGVVAHAQDSAFPQDKPAAGAKPKSRDEYLAPYRVPSVESTSIFHLNTAAQQYEGGEISAALRNMLDPSVKVYLIASQSAIAVSGPPDQIALADKLVKEIDRPHKSYRLTYTLTESDAGKRIGVEHFSIVTVAGQRTTLKQGSKVPIATGQYDDGKSGTQQQFTYLDIGMNFDVTIDQLANGLRLKSKVEQSSIGEIKSIMGVEDPVVRQSVIDGVANITLGKPQALGQIDVPGSTRHLDIEVVAELIP
jgi:hypothetical protein